MAATGHIPVLLETVTRLLGPRRGETYLDCTAGLGGHAQRIAEAMLAAEFGIAGESPSRVILNDMDAANLARASARLMAMPPATEGTPQLLQVSVVTRSGVEAPAGQGGGNFADAPRLLASSGVKADCVLADLGFASNHVDDHSRGFSFMGDGPLDMRLDTRSGLTAADLVNQSSEAELQRLLTECGEERHASRIARKLVQERKDSPIVTTGRLAEIVRSAIPNAAAEKIHPATRTFQALRIAVNDELGSLQALLAAIEDGARMARGGKGGADWLSLGARIAIISFHSLEDRPVKECFARLVKSGAAEDLSGGAVGPTDDEERANPRSRSAKVRVLRLKGVQ